MKFRVRVKKKIKECDGMGMGDFAPQHGEMTPMGMGDANPMGGPDRWDNIFGFGYPKTKKRKYKAKKKK